MEKSQWYTFRNEIKQMLATTEAYKNQSRSNSFRQEAENETRLLRLILHLMDQIEREDQQESEYGFAITVH